MCASDFISAQETQAGVLADLNPPRIGPPGPNPLADMDPPVQIRGGFKSAVTPVWNRGCKAIFQIEYFSSILSKNEVKGLNKIDKKYLLLFSTSYYVSFQSELD